MNLKPYLDQIKFKKVNGQLLLWALIRRKWLVATPEEIVRQSILLFLTIEKNYSQKLIAVEKRISYYNVKKRYDIVVFNKEVEPMILIECKRPEVSLDTKAFYQISAYNEILNGQYLWLSNGHQNVILAKTEGINELVAVAEIPLAKQNTINK